MLTTATDIPVDNPYVDMPLGAAGVGNVTVTAKCTMWAGARTVITRKPMVFQLASMRTSIDDAGGGFVLVLSSGSASFPLAPAPTARLVVNEDRAWSAAQSSGTSCVVTAQGLGARVTQEGTKTRFFADPAAGGAVLLDAVALAAAGAFPAADSTLRFVVQCEHPVAGVGAPTHTDVTVRGAAAAWDLSTTRPSAIAVSAPWPRFAVTVTFSSDILRSLAVAVRCRAVVPGASRVESSEAIGTWAGSVAVVWFDSLAVSGRRGSAFDSEISCSVGDLPIAPTLVHRFAILGCQQGQQPRPNSEDLCDVCPADHYSDGGEGATCVACPPFGVRCAEGILALRQGHYRPPADDGKSIDGSTELHACFNEEACTLNEANRTYGCAEGYSGPLCGVCSDGWAQFGKACGRCWGGASDLGVVAALGFALLLATAFMARRTMGSTDERSSERSIALRQLLSHAQGLGALTLFRSSGTEMFQSVAGLAQGMSASPMSWGPIQCAVGLSFVGRFWSTVALPLVVTGLTTAFVVSMQLSPACCGSVPTPEGALASLRRRRNTTARATGGPRAVQEDVSALRSAQQAKPGHRRRLGSSSKPETKSHNPMLATTGAKLTATGRLGPSLAAVPLEMRPSALPPTGVSASKGLNQLTTPGRDRVRRFFAEQRYVITLAIVMFLTYMSLINLAVTALDCQDRAIAGVTYLSADLSVECYTGAHSAVVVGAVGVLVIVGVGLPVSIVLAFRGSAERPSLRFLSDGYKPRLRWWEATVLIRKMALVMTASLVQDASSQVAAAIFVLVPALVLQMRFWPFVEPRFNILEAMSVSTMIITATLSLVFLRAQGGETAILEGRENGESALVDTVVTIGLVGANAVVMSLQALVVLRAGEGLGTLSCTRSGCCKKGHQTQKAEGHPQLASASATLPSIASSSSIKPLQDEAAAARTSVSGMPSFACEAVGLNPMIVSKPRQALSMAPRRVR